MAPTRFRNKWRVQVWVGGKRQSHFFSRKDDALRKEGELRRTKELERAGLDSPKGEILFSDLAVLFINHRRLHRPRSVEGDERKFRLYWGGAFKTRALLTIKREEILEKLDSFQKDFKWSNAYRNRNRALLHTLWEFAIDRNKAVYNPVTRIPLIQETGQSRVTSYLKDPEKIEDLIRVAYAKSEVLGLLYTVLIFSGPRISEALAYRNSDVDLSESILMNSKTANRDGETEFQGTKGQKEGGYYVSPLFPRVREAILNHRARCKLNSPSDYLFHNEDGSRLTYYQVAHFHKGLLKDAKIGSLTLHDLRRTFGSLAESMGFSRGEVQVMLGHSSISTTERYIRKDISSLVQKGRELQFGEPKKAKVLPIRGST